MNLGGTIRLNKLGTCILCALFVLFLLYVLRNGSTPTEKDNLVDLRKLLIGSIEAAVEGGRKVVSVYNSTNFNVRSKGKTKQGSNDPVTDADMQSHCVMYYSLKQTFPRVKVISEENSSDGACRGFLNLDLDPTVLKSKVELPGHLEPSSDITVWIDPLDATQEFTESLVQYVTTMVCVAVKGVPTIGVIHFPFSGTTTWAWVGKSAPKAPTSAPKVVKVITSRSHMGNVTAVVHEVLGQNVQLIPAGGAGYKSVQVATGNVSVYIHTTEIKKWDICAGNALLRALGGQMTTLSGNDITYEERGDVVNRKGILATLHNHEFYAKQLAPLYQSS